MIISAGIIAFRLNNGQVEVFMAHSTNETRYWSFPKGQIEEGEDPLTAAIREFKEETSFEAYDWTELDEIHETKPFCYLGEIQQRADKIVKAYSVWNPTLDPSKCFSNECEWPRGSGEMIPEIDEYRWVKIDEALKIINPVQIPLLERLMKYEFKRE